MANQNVETKNLAETLNTNRTVVNSLNSYEGCMLDFLKLCAERLAYATGLLNPPDGVAYEDVLQPLLVIGPPGVGKTTGIMSVINEINYLLQENGIDEEVHLKKLSLGTYVPGSLQEIPLAYKSADDTVQASYAQTPILPTEEKDGKYGILFLDEVTTSDLLQMLPALSLGDSTRSIDSYTMPKHWMLILAGNGPEDFNFNRLDTALLTRGITYSIKYSFETDWKNYGKAIPSFDPYFDFELELFKERNVRYKKYIFAEEIASCIKCQQEIKKNAPEKVEKVKKGKGLKDNKDVGAALKRSSLTNIHPLIMGYLEFYPDKMITCYTKKSDTHGKCQANPRTWTLLSHGLRMREQQRYYLLNSPPSETTEKDTLLCKALGIQPKSMADRQTNITTSEGLFSTPLTDKDIESLACQYLGVTDGMSFANFCRVRHSLHFSPKYIAFDLTKKDAKALSQMSIEEIQMCLPSLLQILTTVCETLPSPTEYLAQGKPLMTVFDDEIEKVFYNLIYFFYVISTNKSLDVGTTILRYLFAHDTLYFILFMQQFILDATQMTDEQLASLSKKGSLYPELIPFLNSKETQAIIYDAISEASNKFTN